MKNTNDLRQQFSNQWKCKKKKKQLIWFALILPRSNTLQFRWYEIDWNHTSYHSQFGDDWKSFFPSYSLWCVITWIHVVARIKINQFWRKSKYNFVTQYPFSEDSMSFFEGKYIWKKNALQCCLGLLSAFDIDFTHFRYFSSLFHRFFLEHNSIFFFARISFLLLSLSTSNKISIFSITQKWKTESEKYKIKMKKKNEKEKDRMHPIGAARVAEKKKKNCAKNEKKKEKWMGNS